MKPSRPVFALVVLAFCAWQARDLFDAWRHAPFDRFDPAAFALWALPLAWTVARRRGEGVRINPLLVQAAAALTLLGSLLDLNVLQNLSLATALGSFLVGEWTLWPWLLAAVTWMPVFGWFVSGAGLAGIAAARLAVAGAASGWAFRRLGLSGETQIA